MAQSRLSTTGGTLSIQGSNTNLNSAAAPSPVPNGAGGGPAVMELGVPQPLGTDKGQEPLTADFFRSLIGDNTKKITERIDKMSEDLTSLARTVESNAGEIGKNTTEIQRQAAVIEQQKTLLDGLSSRIEAIEEGRCRVDARETLVTKPKSEEYKKARRSVRMWPIDQSSINSMWKGVGEFMHVALGIPEDDMGPEDIEEVTAMPNPDFKAGNLNNEVLVTFVDARKRDRVVTSAAKLASCVDTAGRPTAGLRLEIPGDLLDIFRLLSRFGTRLRAKHGEGTKRHVKFDDVENSLYMNIKLPGDETWSKVTPQMAKADLDSTTRAESAKILRRIAMKEGTTGPRQRLMAPAATSSEGTPPTAPVNATQKGPGPAVRKNWAPPDKP